jgi:hypothetical protein
MSSSAEQPDLQAARPSRAGLVLVAASVALLVAAGLLLWRRNGDAVFGDLVLAALAWCF